MRAYLHAIAGLANNKGGYLLFGVTDGSFQADGLADDTFTKSDISLINRVLVGSLDPVPHVTKGLIPQHAHWDERLLGENFLQLKELDLDFDLSITGFSLPEIDLATAWWPRGGRKNPSQS